MTNAFYGDFRSAISFCQDEGSLQDCLRMEREALCSDAFDAMLTQCRLDVGLQLFCVPEYRGAACIANGWMLVIGFLNHGTGNAGEGANLAGNQHPAKIDIGQHALQRIVMLMIGRSLEQPARDLRPVICRSGPKRFLAVEVMEKGTLGDACRPAKIVNTGGRISLLPNDDESSVQQFLAGGFPSFGRSNNLVHADSIPTGWYVCKGSRPA